MADDRLLREIHIDPSIGAIEVKITARAQDEDRVRAALDSAGVEAERRDIYFFDTPGLDLFESGLVLRARRIEGGADDSTVKLRPVDPATVAEHWKDTPGFEVELDAVGDTAICSAKLTVDQHGGEIEEVAAGTRAIRKLFSKEQERLIEEHRPQDVGWEHLSVFGPVTVRKWEVDVPDFDYEITVEEWVLPDDSDLVELSVTAAPNEAADAGEGFLRVLRERGLDTEGDQQTKTRSALLYFTTGAGID
jgi:hypothetical protein